MKKIIILIMVLAFASNLQAQVYDPKTGDFNMFLKPDTIPQYPGGVGAFQKYIQSNLEYPPEANKEGIQGKVYIRFVVEKDGSVSNVEIYKGIGGGCDEAAADLIKQSLNWKPAVLNNKPVKVRMIMPISFKLREPEKKKKKRRKG